MIEPSGAGSPQKPNPKRRRPGGLAGLIASVLVAALVGGGVAAGVTVAVIRSQSRTNPQNVSLGSNVTINEEEAAVAVAAKAQPAVVSIVTQDAGSDHGSGFLVTSDGYVVTNVGVVANAQSLTVLMNDNKRHDARLVDYDCEIGLAVLKADQVSGEPTLSFDTQSTLRAGQTVVVVPGALGDTGVVPASIGALHGQVVIAQTWGTASTAQLSDVMRTTAQVGAGESGAPLLNVGGQVVGMTMSATSGGQAVSFTIPATDLQAEVEQIVQGAQLIVPALGAQSLTVSAGEASLRSGTAGARIATLEAGGAAERAGLKAGDVVTQIDDQHLDDAHPLPQVLRERFKPAQKVAVTYVRGGASSQVQLQLEGERPAC